MRPRHRLFLVAVIGTAFLFARAAQAQQNSTGLTPPPSVAMPPASAKVPAATNAATPSASSLIVTKDPASQMVTAAIERVNANDIPGGIAKLTEAIRLNPRGTGAYVLRASLYSQQNQWALAEQDFKSAAQLAPKNTVLQMNLVEIKFMQKEYDAARTGYVGFEKDPDLGDFAAYKVFLCDLLGGHTATAKAELDVFNNVGGNPSYYFSNAAWSLVHKDTETARGWLVSASNIYPPQKNQFYAQSLHDLGYLPLPPPPPGMH